MLPRHPQNNLRLRVLGKKAIISLPMHPTSAGVDVGSHAGVRTRSRVRSRSNSATDMRAAARRSALEDKAPCSWALSFSACA
jgi:hypothetical protein